MSLQAQDYRFIPFNTINGLTQNSVNCIFEDKSGLIWIGTQDGLNSFDGKNFKSFRYNSEDSNSISDQFILSINEDRNGYLWVGTRHGLNRINKKNGLIKRFYLQSNELNDIQAPYFKILKLSNGDLFILHNTHPSIISLKSEPKRLTGITKELNLINEEWGINKLNYLVHFSKYNNTIINVIPTVKTNNNYSGKMDSNKIIWIYNKHSVFFYNTLTKLWLKNNICITTEINDIVLTKENEAWLCTSDGAYTVKNYKTISKIKNEASNLATVIEGNILCGFKDLQNNVWIGSANSGFAFYNQIFNNFKLINSGTKNNVITSSVKISNQYWLGTANGLVIKKGIKLETKFNGFKIVAIVKDNTNLIWVAVYGKGLYIFNTKGVIVKKYELNKSNLYVDRILNLYLDRFNKVHVCTEKGFFIFKDLSNWVSHNQYLQDMKYTGYYVMSAYEDKFNNIWYCKNLGIEIRNKDNKLLKHISSRYDTSAISRSIITSCTEDNNGNMWIGTLRNGIYKYRNNKFVRYSIKNGLTSNLIYGVTKDQNGKIWASSPSGLNVFNPSENRFYTINTSDGLPNTDFLIGSLKLDIDGNILAGSSNGLIEIKPNSKFYKKNTINALISEVKINGNVVNNLTNTLILKHGFKFISFEFSALEKMFAKNIHYQYRLLGVDTTWIELKDNQLSINYSNLPYTKLTMQVRASKSVLDFNTAKITTYSFVTLAPFWDTLWFKILVMFIGIFGMFILIYYNNKRKFNKKLKVFEIQNELQLERIRISRDLHDNIGAYTAALISGISHLKSKTYQTDTKINELKNYASSIMSNLRETIWVLNKEKLTLLEFSDRFSDYCLKTIKNYPNIKLAFNIETTNLKIVAPNVTLHLFRILQEAFQNACKHSNASIITITIVQNPFIICCIEDNGTGILKENNKESYGLQNMKARANEIGFYLLIESDKLNGTKIKLTENNAYAL